MAEKTRVQEAKEIFGIIEGNLGLTSCCEGKFIGFWTSGRQSIEFCTGVFFYKGEGLKVSKNAPNPDPNISWMVADINRAIAEMCPNFHPNGVTASDGGATALTVN